MNRMFCITFLMFSLGTVSVCAQEPNNPVKEQDADSPVQQSARSEDTIQATSLTGQPIGSLDGSGLISVDSSNGLSFSATSAGGWDSNPGYSSQPVSSSVYSISPYIAFHRITTKNKFILQYQPTFLGYPSGAYERQSVHAVSTQVAGRFTERLAWSLNINGSYGQNGARLAAPLQSVAVGEVPGTTSSNASYLPNSGSVAYVFSSLVTEYRKSERSALALELWNSFNRVTGYDQAGGVATGRLRYSYMLSPTLSLMMYTQISHFYGNQSSQGFGVGGGIVWQPKMNSVLSLEAGPQIYTAAHNATSCAATNVNAAPCDDQKGYTYSIQYSARLTNKAQLYLMTSLLPMVSYLGPGTWQRGGSAGMQYQVTRRAMLHADLGYASSTALAAVSSYSGISLNANYDVQLPRNLILSYGYRGYFTDSTQTGYSRSLSLISLKWTSNSTRELQR